MSSTQVDSNVATEIRFASVTNLASALRRAAAAHHEYEEKTGGHDPDWPDWYAKYMVGEQAGQSGAASDRAGTGE